jgi:hypothetical protein
MSMFFPILEEKEQIGVNLFFLQFYYFFISYARFA